MTEICQKDNRHQENVVSCPCVSKNVAPPGGLEPPTFRLTAKRASRLRHGGLLIDLADFVLRHQSWMGYKQRTSFNMM